MFAAKDIARSFGGLLAVSDLSFEIREREVLGLIGPNGAGKSTTFNLISGFYAPTRSKLFIDGTDAKGMSPERISRKGLVRTFRHGSLMRSMTVADNILIGTLGSLPRSERAERVGETARLFSLQAKLDEIAGILPHGLQRLVSIAFASRPRILCLDEPLTGLNQTEVAATLEVFERIRDEFGSSVLLVEHNMKAVMQVCDRIVVLHHGRMLATGSPDSPRSARDRSLPRSKSWALTRSFWT
ncbi:Branched-chain amino acid transport ATP-binding protein LivG [Candidatus Paraburkholderia kirkii]|nr:Branched-chain amino acid transport ATP-binding protein LivG [Candidatus Paraburkholderia kirkii]